MDYSMSRVVVPLKNTVQTCKMCIVNKNIYDDGEYEGWAWIRCDKEPNEPSVHVQYIV